MRIYRVIGLVICSALLSTGLYAKAISTHASHSSATRKISSQKAVNHQGSKTHASSGRSSKSKRVSAKSRKGAWKKHGQQQIANDRTREIQEALIKANYLQGQPSGSLDARTKEALIRFQKDNGWQGKVVPDSRALIKLGLGPDQSNLLNPTTAALPSAKPGEGALSGNQE